MGYFVAIFIVLFEELEVSCFCFANTKEQLPIFKLRGV